MSNVMPAMAASQNSRPNKPPRAVVVACTLFGASFLFAVVRSVSAGGWNNPAPRAIGILILVALTSAVVFDLYRGVNWLRWLIVCGVVLGLLLLPWSLGSIANSTERFIHVCQGILQGAGAVLLVRPSASTWFRPGARP